MEDKKQNNIPTFKNSNISDSLSKSNGTGGTATTTSKDTSEEEMLLQIFNKKKGYKKTRNQKTQTSYYKGYQIKSDQNLKLARSNNFPLRKEQ